MATAFTRNMNKDAILLAIKSIAGRGAALDGHIQDTALSIAAHISEHREVSLATKLYNAMPHGSRRNALVQWFVTFGAVSVNQDKKTSKEFPLVFNKEGTVDLVEGAKKAWFDCKKEKELTDEVFCLADHVKKFQTQLQGWIKKGLVEEDDALVVELLRIKSDVVADTVEPTAETVTE